MKVNELNREQLISLKQDYICNVLNKDEGTSWEELARANEIVSDKTIFDYYQNFNFVEEDFLSSSNEE